ncbi:MAG: peptide deformylase [Gammaproteobacteria bacterium]|jgi:peptide deformylase|nr:peptide deformylase [Gammaproteobacteria bacterium]
MILPILEYPDKRLRTVAKPVEKINDTINKLIKDMFDTMYNAPGIGLAATQVNSHQRIIVVDVSENQNEPISLINPEIIDKSGEIESEEGCLSVPSYYENVKRASNIRIKSIDKNGNSIQTNASGVLAICIQHEIDHLDGILFVDHLSKLKQKRLKKKAQKKSKQL